MTVYKDQESGSAFPNDGPTQYGGAGLSKREWFAGQALTGLIAAYATCGVSPTTNIAEVAKEAVSFADETILNLNRS